jgi:type II secretory pathway pseudopilin PulG
MHRSPRRAGFAETKPIARRGRTLVEVIAIVVILGFVGVWVVMGLPRWRESSRMIGCQNNLRQIGVALQVYHHGAGHYPVVPVLTEALGDSPIATMIETLGVPDFRDFTDPSVPPRPSQFAPRNTRIAGLLCPTDRRAIESHFASPTSYRANTGDTVSGLHGPFQPGRPATIDAIEHADGVAYTAAFAERLLGDGRDGQPDPWNYARFPGPVPESGCPPARPDQYHGDAGQDWGLADWRSTLYNHAIAPNAANSCVASDGKTAGMVASSDHENRIHVLLLDGSVRPVTSTIDAKVWAELGTTGEERPVKAP